jgi:2-keto-4-pentenoate hydratase/2-oxohepta-3-ene-1,7-dioic acid hydratase in catechol pathway
MAVPDEPQIFFKPPSAVIGPGQEIHLPRQSTRVDFEGELALVIAKDCRDIGPEAAVEYTWGLCCANDVTARDLQQRDGLYARAKGFDGFAPLGPWIETDFPDPGDLELETLVNSVRRQSSRTSDMIWSPWQLLAYISTCMTLNKGDVILTGTPPGIGPLAPGDRVQVRIKALGTLTNRVAHPWAHQGQ